MKRLFEIKLITDWMNGKWNDQLKRRNGLISRPSTFDLRLIERANCLPFDNSLGQLEWTLSDWNNLNCGQLIAPPTQTLVRLAANLRISMRSATNFLKSHRLCPLPGDHLKSSNKQFRRHTQTNLVVNSNECLAKALNYKTKVIDKERGKQTWMCRTRTRTRNRMNGICMQ